MQENKHKSSCGCGDDCNCGDDCRCETGDSDKTAKNETKHKKSNKENKQNINIKDTEEYKELLKILTENEEINKELVKYKKLSEDSMVLARNYKNDFERFKERNKSIEKDLKEQVTIEVAEKLLPVMDNFTQAFSVIQDEEITKGFKMIHTQIYGVLKDLGIEEIKALGETFNAELHNAVLTEPAPDENQSGKIIKELAKGYIFTGSGKVIRHSVVVVYS